MHNSPLHSQFPIIQVPVVCQADYSPFEVQFLAHVYFKKQEMPKQDGSCQRQNLACLYLYQK